MVSNYFLQDVLGGFDNFRGVYAADTIDTNILRKEYSGAQEFFIVNTEPISSQQMGHWIAFSRYREDGEVVLELFDSLAYPVSSLHSNIKQIVKSASYESFVTNQRILQSVSSIFCGLYCIARFISLLHEESLKDFLKTFSSDRESNDSRACTYIRDQCIKLK